jgi:ABC-type branched-subunit amino acid transport system permease subunit
MRGAARLGHGALGALALALGVALPEWAELFTVINATIWVAMAMLALSLGLVWGFGGILCLGQTAFFGLGGYAYAIAAINLGDSTLAVPIAVLVPAAFAAALGAFLFYGRLGDVYLGVITLTVTLILFKVMNSTSGPEFAIGAARLGGFNGIPATPPLNAPFDPAAPLSPGAIFRVSMAALAVVYFGCLWLLGTGFGRVAVAIRENELRAELLGYDARSRKLVLFAVGGAIAGLAGVLFANSVFVSPTMFSLYYAAQALIWVIVGGLGTLAGPALGAVAVQYLTTLLGRLGQVDPALARLDPNVVLGLVLVLCVLLLRRGLLPALAALAARAARGRRAP